jgi:BASS family bile acid:Na+ symporter
MTAAQLLSHFTEISVTLIVLSAGMAGRKGDLIYLVRRPSLLIRSLVSMLVLAPVLAVMFATTLQLPKAVKIALVMMAVSPVPPFLPKKSDKAGGTHSYVVSLLATSAIVSIVSAPISLRLLSEMFGLSLSISSIEIAKPLMKTVLMPLVAGVILQRVAPRFCSSWARIVAGVGTILLIAVVIPQLVNLFPQIRVLVGDGTLLAIAAFAICSQFIGHLLGGPVTGDRSVLALCTATRHPFIAMTLIQANYASEKLAVPAVFMTLVVPSVASLPYVRMLRRQHVDVSPEGAPPLVAESAPVSEPPARRSA